MIRSLHIAMAAIFTLNLLAPIGPSGVTVAYAKDIDSDGALAFLEDLRDRVKDYMDINYTYLKKIEACYEYQVSGHANRMSGSNADADFDFYHPEFCVSEMPKIEQRIAHFRPRVRKYQILTSLTRHHATVASFFATYQNHVGSLLYNRPLNFTSKYALDSSLFNSTPFAGTWSKAERRPVIENKVSQVKEVLVQVKEDFTFNTPTDAESHEGQELIDIFFSVDSISISDIERALNDPQYKNPNLSETEDFSGYLRALCKIALPNEPDACLKLQIQIQKKTEAQSRVDIFNTKNPFRSYEFVFNDQKHARIYDLKKFRTELWSQKFNERAVTVLSQIHRHAEAQFFKQVELAPYVLLVPSDNPTDHEILRAMTLMRSKAEKIRDDYNQQIQKEGLGHGQVKAEQLLPLMKYTPVVNAVVRAAGQNLIEWAHTQEEADFQTLSEELTSRYGNEELMTIGVQLVSLIAANIAVCWGAGKLAKFGTSALQAFRRVEQGVEWSQSFKKTFDVVCYSASGAALNSWFLGDAIDEYTKTYEQIFSTALGNKAVVEFRDLNDADRAVVLSFWLWPIGTGAGLILKKIYQKLSASGSPLRAWLKQLQRPEHGEVDLPLNPADSPAAAATGQ